MNQNYGAMGNFQYGNNPVMKPRMLNPLTENERKALKSAPADDFNLNITEEELAKSFCTHKNESDGTYSIVANQDGSVTCTICHATFNPDVCTSEYVAETAARMENVLQTLKFLGVDLNADVIRGYFGYLPYVKRIPQLYRLVNNSFNRYNETSMYSGLQQQNSGANIFNMLGQIMNPAQPFYQMPQPQAPWQQPAQYNPFYAQMQPTAQPQAPWQQNQPNQQQAAMMAPPTNVQQPTAQPQAPVNAPAQTVDNKSTVTNQQQLQL